MELRLGFEPLDDYLKYELYKGAMKLVQDVMLAKPGETVMVTADTSTDMRVANALAAAAYAIDAVPVLVEYPTAKETCIDPPLPLQAAACKTCGSNWRIRMSSIPFPGRKHYPVDAVIPV